MSLQKLAGPGVQRHSSNQARAKSLMPSCSLRDQGLRYASDWSGCLSWYRSRGRLAGESVFCFESVTGVGSVERLDRIGEVFEIPVGDRLQTVSTGSLDRRL